MSQLNIFCFGFGQVAKSFIKKIKDEKIKFKFSTTSREESKIKTFEGVSYQSFKFNEEKFDNNLLKNLKEADYVLVSIAPINNKMPATSRAGKDNPKNSMLVVAIKLDCEKITSN